MHGFCQKFFWVVTLLLPGSFNQLKADVVFSANFESNATSADVGTVHFRYQPTLTLPTLSGTDPDLGTRMLLVDREDPQFHGLGMTWQPLAAVELAGAGANISFRYAARRTNGDQKTTLLTGWDAQGKAVFRLVLGDNDAFDNAGGDQQRPGYATEIGGMQVLPGPMSGQMDTPLYLRAVLME